MPAPRGTTGTPCSLAQRSATWTCSVHSARTAATGRCAAGSRARSQRYLSSPSGSVSTTPSGRAATRSWTARSWIEVSTSSTVTSRGLSGRWIDPQRDGSADYLSTSGLRGIVSAPAPRAHHQVVRPPTVARTHLGAAARAVRAGLAVRDDLAGVHAAAGGCAPDRRGAARCAAPVELVGGRARRPARRRTDARPATAPRRPAGCRSRRAPCWSSSRALIGAVPRPTRSRNSRSGISAASGPSASMSGSSRTRPSRRLSNSRSVPPSAKVRVNRSHSGLSRRRLEPRPRADVVAALVRRAAGRRPGCAPLMPRWMPSDGPGVRPAGRRSRTTSPCRAGGPR